VKPRGRKARPSSRNRASLIVLLLLAALLGYFVYQRLGMRMGGAPSSLRSEYSSEEEWIMGEIVRDVAEMAAYAHGLPIDSVEISQELTPGDPLPAGRFEVRLGSRPDYEGAVAPAGWIWSPESYSTLATELFEPTTRGSGSEGKTPEALLDFRASVLETESARVSARLAADMRDPTAHEEASLLLAAFAMREAAYRFEDFRFLLGRVTAHLAVARSLRGGEAAGPAGAIAEAALLTLAGREEEALRAIDHLVNGNQTAASWQNALFMYTTRDWRVRSLSTDSLLERVMRFRAMVSSLEATNAVERAGDALALDLPDWGRLVTWQFHGDASDSEFISTQMERELAELQEIWTLKNGSALPPLDLPQQLNVPAGRLLGPDGPEVLSWGTWAAFYQRHICGLLAAAEELMSEALDMPDWAAEYRHDARQVFSGLTLHPIVEVRRTRKVGGSVEDTKGMDQSIAVARRHPELVNSTNWLFLADTALHMMRKRGMPRAESWFSRAVLETSVFDTRLRVQLLKPLIGNGDDVAEALREIAPRHHMVLDLLIARLPREENTIDTVAEVLGPRIEYDLVALRQIRNAAPDSPERRAPIFARTCELERNDCFQLGWAYVSLGRVDDAVTAFQKGVEEAPDHVAVCNNANWLVNYYFDQGKIDAATALAERVGDVYCEWGLYTQGYLSERKNLPAEADRIYQALAERYHGELPVSYPLLGFYYRMARLAKSPDYQAAFEEHLSRVFPNGLEPLSDAPDSSPPADGVLIDGNGGWLSIAGLRGADVIVGLDGFRVRTLEQYDAIRNFQPLPSNAAEMRLRIWRQTQYHDVTARLITRRFGERVRTYGTPGPSFEYR
jgi:tetratricopeptide (TPR) repeat protein